MTAVDGVLKKRDRLPPTGDLLFQHFNLRCHNLLGVRLLRRHSSGGLGKRQADTAELQHGPRLFQSLVVIVPVATRISLDSEGADLLPVAKDVRFDPSRSAASPILMPTTLAFRSTLTFTS